MSHLPQHSRVILPLLAIFIALLVILPAVLSVHVLEYDEAIFMDVARNIQRFELPLRSITADGVFFFDHTNLYVYLLSLYASSSELGIVAARLVTVLFGLASVWLTFEIGTRISNPLGGFVAALLVGISPFFALHAFFIRMEVPMVCAMLAGLLLLIENERRPRRGLTVAAGVMLSLAVLFKEVAVLFTGWCAVYVLLVNRRDRRSLMLRLLAVTAPTVLGLLMWAAWAWKLSPAVFTGTMNRWLNSMGAVNLLDPRASVTAGQWAQQLTFDLFGLALVVGLVASLIATIARRPARLTPVQVLLWGYLLSALAISFLVRLKEVRHLIGVLPVAALIIGTSIDWAGLIERLRTSRSRLPGVVVAVAAIAFLLWASPLRVPTGPTRNISSWLDTLYGRRVLENDRFYNVLRLTGHYLQEHTDPGAVVTIAHEAPVTAYYADRRYNMLYTLPRATIDGILQQTGALVWDDEDFQAMTPPEVATLRKDIQARFKTEQVIQDDVRSVIVYR
jgi:4-amino-4-deoxy-L-arabinose transferase-like glycosyltransferase